MKSFWMVGLLAGPLALTACGDQGVSDSTRAERQDLSFDVSGRYAEDAAVGTPSVFTIKNESSVSDIEGTLELRGGLRKADRDALKVALRHDDERLLDADVEALSGRVEAALTSLSFGEGKTFTERGGENVALDHAGDIAEISLRKSVDDIGTVHLASYSATFSLFLTGYQGQGRLDAQITSFTDVAGHGESGVKGLLLTVRRTESGVTRMVTTEMPLTLGKLLKY